MSITLEIHIQCAVIPLITISSAVGFQWICIFHRSGIIFSRQAQVEIDYIPLVYHREITLLAERTFT